jgi:RNA polymerase sigma-70 factor (ECF subfamily)
LTSSDEGLLGRISAADEAALEILYDRYAPAVMGLALRILGDRALAEEVVQETFWRVWSRIGSYRPERGAPASWLFGIAHHHAIDLARRETARGLPPGERPRVEPPDPQVDVPGQAWAALKYQQVVAAMAGLPSEQRQVLELAYFGGLTRREIARVLGAPLGTVHTWARRGLLALRGALQTEGLEAE